MIEKQLSLIKPTYDERFFTYHAGEAILTDPRIAVIELIANAWDAYSRTIEIRWPNAITKQPFSIQDNGSGMTQEEFETRWMRLSYNRRDEQGRTAEPPPSLVNPPKRFAFGKNGIGRHGIFCFSGGKEYFVETAKDGKRLLFRVYRPISGEHPIACELLKEESCPDTGTKIFTSEIVNLDVNADAIRTEIGLRFLSDPQFKVSVDGEWVTFEDIPDDNTEVFEVSVPELGIITIRAINTKETDRTTRQHGIAWWVQKKLVGDVSWKLFNDEKFIDGRRTIAKRFNFIINADCLEEYVNPDWSSFKNHKKAQEAISAVNDRIRQFILDATRQQREDIFHELQSKNASQIGKMSLSAAEKWNLFVHSVQETCPSINEKELASIAEILAKLESSKSKYSLLTKLSQCSTDDLDALNEILLKWDVESAKIVLDELQLRLRLISDLRVKCIDNDADEVHDLQPLFEQGLWIFGPEFESIHYTSNEGMTRVIQEHFASKQAKKKAKGSKNRPDFTITFDNRYVQSHDSSIGAYACHSFAMDATENGFDRLVIVELKKPSVRISTKEKDQCWKYVKELYERGHLVDSADTRCFVLSKNIDPREAGERTEYNGRVKIIPMTYNFVITKAYNRTFKLFEKIRTAPFLEPSKAEISAFLDKGLTNDGLQQMLEVQPV